MMHQQAASSHYSAAQGGAQHYQGQSMAMMGQSGQGSGMIGQRPMAPYRPSQQGSSQQYLGQEEYYGGEQYGHSQAASEPLSQQYYPDGELRRSQSRPRHPNTRWQSSQSPLWGWGGGGHPALGGEVL